MKNITTNESIYHNSVLIGITETNYSKEEDVLGELISLVQTAGFNPKELVVIKNNKPSPKFGIGTGKAAEIIKTAKEIDANFIIFDFNLTPSHQKNWERAAGLICFDRQEIIIKIFAQRALTKEAVLQVELAQLEYSLPRLVHTYEYLSRQRGGRYGTKGSGETQLELDRRSILDRIAKIKKELIKVRKTRATQRKKRQNTPVPSCALVGYTNVGKSSLLNALTNSSVLVENRLFATLDPTTRRYKLKSGKTILLTDTVGFIKNIPHTLIDAFYATLEEAAFSDLIILVLDATEKNISKQLETSITVLDDIGAKENQKFIVLNKADKIDDYKKNELKEFFPEAIFTSAVTGLGFEDFAVMLENKLAGTEGIYKIPLKRTDLVAFAHRAGIVVNAKYNDDSIILKAKTKGKLKAVLKKYKIS